MVKFYLLRSPKDFPAGLAAFLIAFLGKQWNWTIGQDIIEVEKPLEIDEAQELGDRLRYAGYNIGRVEVGCLTIPA